MFDARAAKALAAGDHLMVDEAPGLRLEARAVLRTWVYRYKSPVDGRMKQIKLGAWPAMGFTAALAAWETARQQRVAGADPAGARREARRAAATQRQSTAYTVQQACREYLAAYVGAVTPKTYAEAERLLTGELGELASRSAAEVTRAEVFDHLEAMAAERPVLANRMRQLMGAVWDRAHDAGRLPSEVPNWWRLVLRGKLRSRGKVLQGARVGTSKRVLGDAELRALLAFLPNFSRDVDDALTLYLWTLCRGAEICAMQPGEIATETDGLLWWTIPRAKLKMRRNPLTVDLRVPLVGRAEAVVRRRLEARPGAQWVFPSIGKSGHVEQKAIGVAVWSHMPYAGTRPDWVRPRLSVIEWAPHDLRRTGRTLLAALGCPAEVAEALLGHLPPGVQGIYNRHQYDAERRLWLTRLAAYLESLERSQIRE